MVFMVLQNLHFSSYGSVNQIHTVRTINQSNYMCIANVHKSQLVSDLIKMHHPWFLKGPHCMKYENSHSADFFTQFILRNMLLKRLVLYFPLRMMSFGIALENRLFCLQLQREDEESFFDFKPVIYHLWGPIPQVKSQKGVKYGAFNSSVKLLKPLTGEEGRNLRDTCEDPSPRTDTSE